MRSGARCPPGVKACRRSCSAGGFALWLGPSVLLLPRPAVLQRLNMCCRHPWQCACANTPGLTHRNATSLSAAGVQAKGSWWQVDAAPGLLAASSPSKQRGIDQLPMAGSRHGQAECLQQVGLGGRNRVGAGADVLDLRRLRKEMQHAVLYYICKQATHHTISLLPWRCPTGLPSRRWVLLRRQWQCCRPSSSTPHARGWRLRGSWRKPPSSCSTRCCVRSSSWRLHARMAACARVSWGLWLARQHALCAWGVACVVHAGPYHFLQSSMGC